MKPFPFDRCAPPSTLPEGGRATQPEIDDRPTDPDPKPASFVPFGKMTDSELRELMKHALTPLPISRREAPPTSSRTFVVYERIVDTRALRRGARPERSGLVDLLSVVVLVGLFTGMTAVGVLALAPDPPHSRANAPTSCAITSQNSVQPSAASTPGARPKLP